MDFFEKRELTAQAAQQALSVLAAVATAVKNRAAIKELTDLVSAAVDGQAASEAATALAKQEREAADAKLTELETKGRDHTEWIERTTKELRQQPAIDPAKMGAEKIKLRGKDGVDFELGAEDITRLMEQHATEASRKAQLPATPQDYKAELPKDLKLPVEVQINQQDPALVDLRNFAHRAGWSQDQFAAVLGIEAARQAKQSAAFTAARDAEVQKLGANAAQRIDAISQFIRGALGDDMARPMLASLATERQVRG